MYSNIKQKTSATRITMRPLDSDLYNGLVNLAKTFAKTNPKTFVEIGSYNGESLEVFRNHLPKDCKIFCIDPWLNNYDENDAASEISEMNEVEASFDRVMRKYRNIAKLKFISNEIFELFDDESLDIVYIDGNHKYEAVKEDIKLYLPKIKEDGIISGHDYDVPDVNFVQQGEHETNKSLTQGVTRAIVEMIGEPDQTFKDLSWLKYKKNI